MRPHVLVDLVVVYHAVDLVEGDLVVGIAGLAEAAVGLVDPMEKTY
jgi:hypothetical protein